MKQQIPWNNTAPNDTVNHEPDLVFAAGSYNHHIANTAYPINHVRTMRDYRIRNHKKQAFVEQAWDGIDELGFYAHVPFCEQRCSFCEYTVVDPKKSHNVDTHTLYFAKLQREIEMYANLTDLGWKKIRGFDIGWGTPSAVDAIHIENLINTIGKNFILPSTTNISIETTPKIASGEPEKIKAYRDMGIERISMWVQSISKEVLEAVGRTNTSVDRNKKATDHIRKAGFDSFNIDIMYGLVGQTVEKVQATLQHVFDLNPEHITIYRTRYKWTRMQEKWYKLELEWIQDQSDLIKQMLSEHGYKALMGKNTFSRIPGSSGASTYLTERVVNGTPYVWVWLGAQSLGHKILSYNQGAGSKEMSNYFAYIEKNEFPIQDIYHLSPEAGAGKFVAVSFYFGGIHLPSFEDKFWKKLDEMFPQEVNFVIEQWYMQYEEDRLQLTEKWTHNYSGVISLFYAPSVKSHLIDLYQAWTSNG